MSVYQKLNAARAKFHTLQLKKSGYNSYAKYDYFELRDFIIPALNTFGEVGLCAFISFGKDTATMRIVDTEDASFIELTSPMSTCEMKGLHEVQRLGAVQTYLRRYLWVAALEIVEHDALDSSAPLKEKTAAPVIPASPPTESLEIDEETLSFLNEFSVQIAETAKQDAKAALQSIQAAGLDNDQRIALNNMLDSKTRSALKKAKEIATA